VNLVRACPVTMGTGLQRSGFCPTPIAIKNHGNVLRFGERLNFFENPSAVETIEEAFPHQRSHPSHRTTVVLSEGLG
jgi:hypothetical protein